MYGVKQLQHAAAKMHALWNNGENNYNSEQPTERYVAARNNRERDVTDVENNYITNRNNNNAEGNTVNIDVNFADDSNEKGDDPHSTQLCLFGVPQYNVSLQNTCAGYVCTVEEVYHSLLLFPPSPPPFPLLFLFSYYVTPINYIFNDSSS